MWLRLLSRGNMMYIPTPLSKFRIHPGNEQLQYRTRVCAAICWALTIREAMERDLFLHDLGTRRKAIVEWLKMASEVLRIAAMIPELWAGTEFHDLLCVYAAMAEALRKDCRIDFDIDTTLVLQMDED